MRNNRELSPVGIISIFCTASAVACGPNFPNCLLDNGDAAVTQAPVAVFTQEIERLSPTNAVPFKVKGLPADELDYREAVMRLDLKEVAETARHGAGVSQADLAAYRKAREAMFDYDQARGPAPRWDDREARKPRSAFVAPVVPEFRGVAREFSDYLQGSIRWYQGQTNAAIGAWSALLARPLEERHQRSTWAAFMLGKAYLGQRKWAEAVTHFQLVRRLAREGLADDLGLAASSYGWEARAELDRKNTGRALALYLDQLATGDDTAMDSLKYVAEHAWDLPAERQAELVRNAPARRVLVAYALSQQATSGGLMSKACRAFLAAVEAAGLPLMEEADRLAWAAYRAGDMTLAGRFLVLAPRDSVMTQFLESKLLLRQGREQEAMETMARLARLLPERTARHGDLPMYGEDFPVWELCREPLGDRLRGELGVLHLARREFVQALDQLYRGGYWEDAAYVAERVLTSGELQAYVDKNCPEEALAPRASQAQRPDGDEPPVAGDGLRYVLGRRLVRAGAYAQARPYLPPELRPVLAAYARHQRVGNDAHASRAQRADALWKAACIARYVGMELMGTEVDPDWTLYQGAYECAVLSGLRARPGWAVRVPASAKELELARQSAPTPYSRFHYRAIAHNLAWRAALLMPDESAPTAEVLCTAGGWLIRDFERGDADRFYKALVKRCGQTTALGRQAGKLHWFPDRKVDRKKLLDDATEAR